MGLSLKAVMARGMAVALAVFVPFMNQAWADQALVDAACAGQPVDRGERTLDRNDPLDSAILARFGAVCRDGRNRDSLRELTSLSFGVGLRTYDCGFWIPRHRFMFMDFDERHRLLKETLGEHLRDAAGGRFLGQVEMMAAQGRHVLIVTKDGKAAEIVSRVSELEARSLTVTSVWGAADLIGLTNDSLWSAARPNLCGRSIETQREAWLIRGVVLARNCGMAFVRDYRIGRDARKEILTSENKATGGACVD